MNLTNIFQNIRLKPKDVLILASVLLIGVFILLYFLFKQDSADNFKSEIEGLTKSVRTHFQKSIDYHGLNTQYVIKNAIAPKEMIRANKLFSKSQNQIFVGRDIKGNPVGVFEKSFGITYLNLNQKKCHELLLTEFSEQSGLIGILLSNEKLYEFSYGGTPALPVTQDAARSYCQNKNTIMLTFE